MGDDNNSRTVHRLWRARKNHHEEQGKSRSHNRTDKRSSPPRHVSRPVIHAHSCMRQVPFLRKTNYPCHEY